MKGENKMVSGGFFAAIAASLCCIAPVLAILAGTGGIASSLSWLEPFRPYLVGLSSVILGFAWYRQIRRKGEIDCSCDEDHRPKLIQRRKFLGIMTLCTALVIAFPYYSQIFYPEANHEFAVVDNSHLQTVEFSISGMTCTGCEEHINHEVNKLSGILKATTSYEEGSAIVAFDNSKTSTAEIEKAIKGTGYSVTNKKGR